MQFIRYWLEILLAVEKLHFIKGDTMVIRRKFDTKPDLQ